MWIYYFGIGLFFGFMLCAVLSVSKEKVEVIRCKDCKKYLETEEIK